MPELFLTLPELPNNRNYQCLMILWWVFDDFEKTPQYFYDQFNHPVESFIVDSPVIFNTRMLHAVPRELTDTGPRWVLMMDLFEWVDKLFDKIDNGTIWKDTKNFKIDDRKEITIENAKTRLEQMSVLTHDPITD